MVRKYLYFWVREIGRFDHWIARVRQAVDHPYLSIRVDPVREKYDGLLLIGLLICSFYHFVRDTGNIVEAFHEKTFDRL